jgi:hypothetical protein
MTGTMKSMLVAAAATVAFAGTAQAQVCAGFPTMAGQFSVDAFANFPDGVNQFGANGSYNLSNPLAVSATVMNSSPDYDGADSYTTFGAGVALKAIQPAAGMTGLSLCPQVGAYFTKIGDLNFTEIPIGVGIGTSVALGQGNTAIQPYLIPSLVMSRFSMDGESMSETDFGIRGGANVSLDRFFVGATVSHMFVDTVEGESNKPTFGIRVGFRM